MGALASLMDISKPHLAYYSVPAALMIAFMPNMYKGTLAGDSFDIALPRRTYSAMEKNSSFNKQTLLRYQRAEAASANGLETVGLYAGAIAAAGAAGVPAETLNYLSASYLVSRVLYNYVYVILQDNRKWAPVRSLLWTAGLGVIFTLWIKAGNLAAAAV
ncbi:unnamed protein product [Discula destructiva]